MKIHVANYGVVGDATIDFSKPLTIFCGSNGTGKTYMSYITYAICTIVSSPGYWRRNFTSLLSSKEFIKEKIDIETNTERWLFKISVKAIKKMYQDISAEVKDRIDEIFGLSDEDAELMFKRVQINFPIDDEEIEANIKLLHFNIAFKAFEVECQCIKEDGYNVSVVLHSKVEQTGRFMSNIMKEIIKNSILTKCLNFNISKPYFLPVERNSIYTFSRELSLSRNNLIDEILQLPNKKSFDPFSYLQKGSKRYPLAIRDAINIANDLSTIKKQKGEYYEFATQIEEKLLHGKVEVTTDGDVIFLPKGTRVKKESLPIHMTASIVKTLSSFVFYLKYQAQRNHLVIIDEPEMNFHPDSQILFVSIVAELMKLGLRFLISTHSDYIIREFNKLILTKAVCIKQNKLDDEGISVSKEDVNAYYFSYPNNRAKKVVVQKLEVADIGFSVPSIDAVVDIQNQQIENLLTQFYFD